MVGGMRGWKAVPATAWNQDMGYTNKLRIVTRAQPVKKWFYKMSAYLVG